MNAGIRSSRGVARLAFTVTLATFSATNSAQIDGVLSVRLHTRSGRRGTHTGVRSQVDAAPVSSVVTLC